MKRVATEFAARLLEQMNKGSRQAVAVRGTDLSDADVRGFLSTGCPPLDYYLTPYTARGQFRGGYPLGRVVEIYGPEGSGKSTLAMQALVNAQRGAVTSIEWQRHKDGSFTPKLLSPEMPTGSAALIDSEVSFDKLRAQSMGLDLDTLLLPAREIDTMEKELAWMDDLLDKAIATPGEHGPLCIVWDSVAASLPEKTKESEYGESQVAVRARLLQEAMRKLPPKLALAQATLVCVNQVTDKIGQTFGFGPQETVPGGRALKFRASVRLRMVSKGPLEEGSKNVVGIHSLVKVYKSKIGPDKATFSCPVRYDGGIDADTSLALYLSTLPSAVVWFEKQQVFVEVEKGQRHSVPLRGRGLKVLLDSQEGLRARLHAVAMASLANTPESDSASVNTDDVQPEQRDEES